MREHATERAAPLSARPVSHAILRAARLYKALAGRLLRESGPRPGQERVLMVLWDQGPQRQVDLVTAVDSDAPAMTRGISRMGKAGLVRRRPSPTDGCEVIVEATEASLALRDKVDEAWAELERLTTTSLSAARQREILADLTLLESVLTRADS